MLLEESFIYFPEVYPAGDWHPIGLEFEDVTFASEDGTRLHGWYVPAAHPRQQLLFFHGNAGNLSHRAYLVKMLADELRVSVFIFDYRGYGRSEGTPSEAGILADSRAAQAWLARHVGINEPEMVLMGRSLGGAIAVDLAANRGAKGLILESTFTSMPDVAAYHYPMLPIRALMRTQFDSLSKIARYPGPLLQSHSPADEIIPFELGRRLFDAATGQKEFLSIAGAGHNDPQPAEFYQSVDRFLERLGGEA